MRMYISLLSPTHTHTHTLSLSLPVTYLVEVVVLEDWQNAWADIQGYLCGLEVGLSWGVVLQKVQDGLRVLDNLVVNLHDWGAARLADVQEPVWLGLEVDKHLCVLNALEMQPHQHFVAKGAISTACSIRRGLQTSKKKK